MNIFHFEFAKLLPIMNPPNVACLSRNLQRLYTRYKKTSAGCRFETLVRHPLQRTQVPVEPSLKFPTPRKAVLFLFNLEKPQMP